MNMFARFAGLALLAAASIAAAPAPSADAPAAAPPAHISPPPDPSLPTVSRPALEQLSDTRARQAIIARSIRRYGAPCACDYQLDKQGKPCGARAGRLTGPRHPKPICTPAEVTDAQLKAWRQR